MPNSVVVYWYFTFAETEKQKVSNLLCSWMKDLCCNRRDTPQVLKDAYAQFNRGQQQPTYDKSISMLEAVIKGFEHTYLIIDAEDECPRYEGERDLLLNTIKRTHEWDMDCVHIPLTSRKRITYVNSWIRSAEWTQVLLALTFRKVK